MKEGWNTVRMSEAFELQMGKTPSRDNSEYWNGDETWVSISDMGNSKYIANSKEGITPKAIEESGIKIVPQGCVIMSFKLSVGKVAITECPIYTNEAIMSFKPKDEFDLIPEYIYYYLKGYKWDGINRAAMGQTLNKATISQGLFSYPPLAEQERIVAELDLLSGIIDKQKAQLKELDNLAQSIFYDMFNEQVAVNEGWECATVGDLYKFQYGKGNKIPESKGIYPCYGSNGMVGYHTEYNSEDAPVIGHIGAYAGIVNWGKGKHFVTYNGVMCWLKGSETNPLYGYYMLKSQNYLEAARNGMAQPFVSYNTLEAPIVYVPPKPLQDLFAEKIQLIESQKESINQSIAESQKLFDYTMDKYFS